MADMIMLLNTIRFLSALHVVLWAGQLLSISSVSQIVSQEPIIEDPSSPRNYAPYPTW